VDVLVTGSSGFLGSALVTALEAGGHRPIRAARAGRGDVGADTVAWDPDGGTMDAGALEGIDAVVHLAGAGIGERRWTNDRKHVIRNSRARATKLLTRTLVSLDRKPSVLVSGSAIGYYGTLRTEDLTEASPPGDGFLADVCAEWEAAAAPVRSAGIRLVTIRTGSVLGRDGGLLGRLLPVYQLGLGGKTRHGDQWMSWISLTDEIAAILFALQTDAVEGPVNLTTPNAVSNAEFAHALGRALHRPAFISTPLTPLRLLYGRELVESLLLASQRVLPEVLEASGFEFRYPTLDDALRHELARDRT
jgi:uncharacterized protein